MIFNNNKNHYSVLLNIKNKSNKTLINNILYQIFAFCFLIILYKLF